MIINNKIPIGVLIHFNLNFQVYFQTIFFNSVKDTFLNVKDEKK